MSWRIHLASQSIQHLDFFIQPQPSLAVWVHSDHVYLYDLESGDLHHEQILDHTPEPELNTEAWRELVRTLKIENTDQLIPRVNLGGMMIYTTDDGNVRLYQQRNQLQIEIDGKISKLDIADFQTFGFDHQFGVIALVNAKYELVIYYQDELLGQFEVGLEEFSIHRPMVAIKKGGQHIFVTDGKRIVCVSQDGQVEHSLELFYNISAMTCSPDGKLVATSDLEYGLIRVYSGDRLRLLYQRHGYDLMAEANQVQLLANLPPESAAVDQLIINNDGKIAFGMSGIVCMTSLEQMDAIPGTQQS